MERFKHTLKLIFKDGTVKSFDNVELISPGAFLFKDTSIGMEIKTVTYDVKDVRMEITGPLTEVEAEVLIKLGEEFTEINKSQGGF